DFHVTGVQTCALRSRACCSGRAVYGRESRGRAAHGRCSSPASRSSRGPAHVRRFSPKIGAVTGLAEVVLFVLLLLPSPTCGWIRSEERRVGKECRRR